MLGTELQRSCQSKNSVGRASVRQQPTEGAFQEANLPLPKVPILLTKPRSALADPYPAAVNIPKCAPDGTSNYEAELCVVIGKTGRDIAEDAALDYVLGYTASNDVSARTLQMLTGQWLFSKGLDGSCPIGPCLRCIPTFQLKIESLMPCRSGPRVLRSHQRSATAIDQSYLRWCRGAGWSHERHDLYRSPRD